MFAGIRMNKVKSSIIAAYIASVSPFLHQLKHKITSLFVDVSSHGGLFFQLDGSSTPPMWGRLRRADFKNKAFRLR